MFHFLKRLRFVQQILVKRIAPNLSVSVYEPKFELTPYHVTNWWEEGWLWLRYLYLSRPDDWLNAVVNGLVAMQEYILCERRSVGASVRCQFILCRRLIFIMSLVSIPFLFNESWKDVKPSVNVVNPMGSERSEVSPHETPKCARRSVETRKWPCISRPRAVTIVGMTAMFSSDYDYHGRQSSTCWW